MKVIEEVVSKDLCSGCGACVGVCPTTALNIDCRKSYQPEFDPTLCTNCGLCYEVCPGKGYPVYKLAQVSCDDKTKMHVTYGPFRHFWLGHSIDPGIRLESASGGIATALLVHLLESKQVEAVAVVTMEDGYPAIKLTDDLEVVLSATGSKYSPVPMMLLIKELQKNPRKIAMTVTPCQLAAYLMATKKVKAIRECLVVAIGLFCGQAKEYEAVSKIAATLDIKYPGDAKFLGWRYGPYPGSLRFELNNGTIKEKPIYPAYDIAIPHYALHRCFLCPDGGNWLADLTLGDIHAGGNDETVIVCRTARAEKMLRSAEAAGALELKDMTAQQVESSVIRGITNAKLKPALARIKWLKEKGSPVPQYDYPADDILKTAWKRTLTLNIIIYRLCMWVRKGVQRKYLENNPRIMEKSGHILYVNYAQLAYLSAFPLWGLDIIAHKLVAKLKKKFRIL